MDNDKLDFVSVGITLMTDNYFRIEALRGYCESMDGGSISSTMVVTLLEEISKKQKEIISFIDSESTNLAYNSQGDSL